MSGTGGTNNDPSGTGTGNNPNPNPAGQDPSKAGGNGNGGISSLEDALKVIKDLRDENASYRTKAKGLESELSTFKDEFKVIKEKLVIKADDEDPKKVLSEREARIAELEAQIEFAKTARELGVAPEQEELFAVLINQKSAKLKEGEELSEEEVQDVLTTLNQISHAKKAGTGVGSGGKKPDDGKGGQGGDITVEQFAKMTITQKNELYLKNADLYGQLFAEAKQKKMLR